MDIYKEHSHYHVLFLSLFTWYLILYYVLRPKKNALFLLDLTMEKGVVTYNTDLDSFERVVINLFDKGISCTKVSLKTI